MCVPVRACNGGCQLGHVVGEVSVRACNGDVPVRACMLNRMNTLHTGTENIHFPHTHLVG